MQDVGALQVQVGETVQIYAIAFLALVYFQNTRLAHRRVDFVDGNGNLVALEAVSELVPVEDQTVRRCAEGQDVIGGPLIEQIVLIFVILIRRKDIVVGILVVRDNLFH